MFDALSVVALVVALGVAFAQYRVAQDVRAIREQVEHFRGDRDGY